MDYRVSSAYSLPARVRQECVLGRQRWPEDVTEAIWALACDGLKPTAISRILTAGPPDSPLDRVAAIPRDTVSDKLQKLKAERGEPETAVLPGTEIDAAGSLRRKILEMARTEITRLDAKETLTQADAKQLVTLLKIVDDAEDRLKAREKEKDEAAAKGGRNGRRMPDLMAMIRANEAKRSDSVNGEPAPSSSSLRTPADDDV